MKIFAFVLVLIVLVSGMAQAEGTLGLYGDTGSGQMEENLDEVAMGRANWKKTLDTFYKDFKKKLAVAESEKGGMRQNDPTDTDIECPTCGRTMQIRTASTGVFLGCSGYALPPKERCKSTINLVRGDEVVSADEAEDEVFKSGQILSDKTILKIETH